MWSSRIGTANNVAFNQCVYSFFRPWTVFQEEKNLSVTTRKSNGSLYANIRLPIRVCVRVHVRVHVYIWSRSAVDVSKTELSSHNCSDYCQTSSFLHWLHVCCSLTNSPTLVLYGSPRLQYFAILFMRDLIYISFITSI